MTHHLLLWMGHSPSAQQQKPPSSLSLQKNLQTAIQHQDEIGRDNFIRGRVAKKWYVVQKDFPLSKSPSTWSKKLIEALIQASELIWSVRNTMKFGETTPTLNHSQLRLQPRITHHYMTFKNTIHINHHHLFSVPLTQRITFSAQENSQWLKTVKAALQIQKKLQKQFFATHPKISTYFSPNKKQRKKPTTQGNTQDYTPLKKKRKTLRQTSLTIHLNPPPPPSDAPT